MKRVLITGCAGYIGSVLTQHLLSRNYFVSGIDSLLFGGEGMLGFLEHPNFIFYKGDIREERDVLVALQDVEIVVHLASLVGEPACSKDKLETEDINTKAVGNLLVLSEVQGVKHFIQASTCSNYGISGDKPATEETELQPLSLYAETKIEAEKLVLARKNGMVTSVLRFATAYGLSPRMRFDLLLNELVKDAFTEKWVLIYGPDSYRPFVHVRDIARSVEKVIRERLLGVWNIGGHNWKKKTLATEIQYMDSSVEVEFKEGKRDPRNYQVSFDKAKNRGFPELLYCPYGGIFELLTALEQGIFNDPHAGKYRNA